MGVHVALLRAINVGGHNLIPMAELAELLNSLGFAHVSSYLQSGNVVCTSDQAAPAVALSIREAVAEHFGHDIAVMVRSREQMERVVANFPYAGHDPKQTGVVFLGARFNGELETEALAPDECIAAGSHVYVHCPTSFAKTKLTNAWVEKQTGLAGTRRNWTTVVKLAEMARSG